jgi:AraC-like DNA-binding protein
MPAGPAILRHAIMPKAYKIAARTATFIVQDLAARGASVDEVLKEAGLGRADIADPEARVPYAAVLRLIERAAAITGDADYGLRLGARRDQHDGGLLGFVLLNSPTLMQALANLQRFFHVIGEGEDFEIERTGPLVTVRFRESEPGLRGQRHNSDYIAALLVRACRDMTRKRIAPRRAQFIHRRPNVPVGYDAYLGCPVEFDAPWDALVFSSDTLALPVIGADERLLKVLEDACRRVLGPGPARPDILHDVRAAVLDAIGKGPLRLGDVGAALGIAPKTLERRLRSRQTTFSALVEDVRHELSKQFLRDTDLSLDQVAYLVGYTATAAWLRAFRRWTGITPGRYRQRHGRRVPAGQ